MAVRWLAPGAAIALVACGSRVPDADSGFDVPTAPVDSAVPTDAASDVAIAPDTAVPIDAPSVDAATPTAPNVVSAIVDTGPVGAASIDTLYVTITLCRPGTTTCQTIDHVEVDTGSSGLRVLASVLEPTLALTDQTAPAGSGTLLECFQFADGYTWGPVATADLHVGGETARNVALQVIGDARFATIPRACSRSGPAENTLADFGANGLIGIGPTVADCGADCADTASPSTGDYYACTAAGCTVAAVPDALQVLNPVTLFPTDHNGSVIQLPAIDPSGQVSASGYLIFGIGTQSNNALGSATVLTADDVNGYITTTFNGQTLDQSYIDSGSNAYYVTDSALPDCTGDNAGFDCPASTQTLTARNTGLNGMSSTVTFRVANADALFGSSSNAAYDDLGGAGSDASFAWGLPFFFGRSVFTAIVGAPTPGGVGPFFAY